MSNRFGQIALFLAVGSAFLPSCSVQAADIRVLTPSGWTPNPYFFAAAGDNVAVALSESGNSDPLADMKVLQYRDGNEFLTDLSGKVFGLTYSPDGHYLLVHHLTDGGEPGIGKRSLLDSSGAVVWTKDDARTFSFSSTGEIIYAWDQESGLEAAFSEIEVFSLSGESIRRVTIDGGSLRAVQVLGNGDTMLLGVGHSIALIDSDSGNETMWQEDLGEDDPGVLSFFSMSSSRFVALLYYGCFKVLRDTGTVEYTFDPVALAANDPERTPLDYARLRVFPGPTEAHLWLFDGTSNGFVLEVPSGDLVPTMIDTSVPPGFTLSEWIQGNRLVLTGSNQLRIRPLPQIQ